jgi:hypothetical protein
LLDLLFFFGYIQTFSDTIMEVEDSHDRSILSGFGAYCRCIYFMLLVQERQQGLMIERKALGWPK